MASSNTITYLKEAVKKGFLTVTFLVSFFVLSGYVNNSGPNTQAAYTELYNSSHFTLKSGISYKRATLSFYKGKPSRFALKTNFNWGISVYNKLAFQRYQHLKGIFLFTKRFVTYQVWNLSDNTDQDIPSSPLC